MGILAEVQKKAEELEKAKQKALKTIAFECSKFKNEKIKYISKKPRIYIMNFSDLKDSWSPDYYDFEYQFKAIIYILKHTNANNLINKWETIKIKGIACFLPNITKEYNMKNPYQEITKDLKLNWYNSNYHILKFHPDVVSYMDNLLLN